MSTFVELTPDEMDDLYALCMAKSYQWDKSSKQDACVHSTYYKNLSTKFNRSEMNNK